MCQKCHFSAINIFRNHLNLRLLLSICQIINPTPVYFVLYANRNRRYRRRYHHRLKLNHISKNSVDFLVPNQKGIDRNIFSIYCGFGDTFIAQNLII